MAGYSGTPLPKKLGIKEGALVGLIDAPEGFEGTLGALPAGASLTRTDLPDGACDVVILFVTLEADLSKQLETAPALLTTQGGLWIAWPKKASKRPTDLSDGLVRSLGLGTGLVDNKVCAIDDVWSALRFVKRLADR